MVETTDPRITEGGLAGSSPDTLFLAGLRACGPVLGERVPAPTGRTRGRVTPARCGSATVAAAPQGGY
jgi:hypothetical protein